MFLKFCVFYFVESAFGFFYFYIVSAENIEKV